MTVSKKPKPRRSKSRKPKGYWTLEKCKEDALDYTTRKEWQNKSSGYISARRNNWIDICCNHMTLIKKPTGYWPLDKLEQYHELKESFFKSKGIDILFIEEENRNNNQEKEIEKCIKFLE